MTNATQNQIVTVAPSDLGIDYDRIIYGAQFMSLHDNPQYGTCPQGIFCHAFPTSETTQTEISILADFYDERFQIQIVEKALPGHFYKRDGSAMEYCEEITYDVVKELPDTLKEVLRHNLAKNKTDHLITTELVREMARTIHYRLSECLIRFQSYKYQVALKSRVAAYNCAKRDAEREERQKGLRLVG